MRVDVPLRLIPLAAAPLIFCWLTGTPPAAFGLTLAHPSRAMLLAVPLAIAGFLVAAGFAEYLSRRSGRWFVPTGPDLAVQTLYYAALNAPVEEWFFRGFLQGGLSRWWHVPALALLLATAIFGGYHLLDRWAWRPTLGATAAGLALGLIYLWQPDPPSLLTPILVHGAITAGFLSLGPYLMYRWRLARRQIGPIPEPTTAAS